MIVVDANLLIYAVNSDSPRHTAARAWLERTLSGTVEVGLAWIVILAFLRITTRLGILERPLTAKAALDYAESWLAQPFVTAIAPGQRHWVLLRGLLEQAGAGGNLTSDAHLAALALEHGGEIYSADYDFRRFPDITHVDPLS